MISSKLSIDTYDSPFHFSVIDNFLKLEVANKVLECVNNLKNENANSIFQGSVYEHNKYAFNINLDAYLEEVFRYLVSDEFVDKIEDMTGIRNLIRNDLTLLGAGIHRITRGGYLKDHTDFNSYTHPYLGKLDRRINLLIYLNPEWKDEYNGHLLLSDRVNKKINFKIRPVFNRCVIFNTTNKSVHGHPYPLNTEKRQSIAVYYYTKNENVVDFEGDHAHSTLWYNTDDYDTKDTIIL
jgi:Rps23 Pro-64 3,4-dihydroxylase Tpa1-like proline 4-hydroxylase